MNFKRIVDSLNVESYKNVANYLVNNFYAQLAYKLAKHMPTTKQGKASRLEVSFDVLSNNVVIVFDGYNFRVSVNGKIAFNSKVESNMVASVCNGVVHGELNGEIKIRRPLKNSNKPRTIVDDRLELNPERLAKVGLDFPASVFKEFGKEESGEINNNVKRKLKIELKEAEYDQAIKNGFITEDLYTKVGNIYLLIKRIKIIIIPEDPTLFINVGNFNFELNWDYAARSIYGEKLSEAYDRALDTGTILVIRTLHTDYVFYPKKLEIKRFKHE